VSRLVFIGDMDRREILIGAVVFVVCFMAGQFDLLGRALGVNLLPPQLTHSFSIACPSSPKAEKGREASAAVADGLIAKGSGWKTVAYYRGDNPEFNDHYTSVQGKWKSQAGQDVAVADIFNHTKGLFFVDLAANDHVALSNTFALEQMLDWRGLCIEVNPKYVPGLTQRKCHLAVAAVGSTTGGMANFTFADEFGGLVGSAFDNKKLKADAKFSKVPLVALEKIFTDFSVPAVIDYLSLDIEGAELFAFEHFPWHKYKFLTLTVERPKLLRKVLESHGYVYVRDQGKFGDALFIHRTLWNFNSVMRKYRKKKGKSKS